MTNEVEEFERELRLALRPVDAPAGFADKVMAEASRPERGRLLGFPRRHAWIGSVAASLLLAALLFGGVEHHRRTDERTRAERDFARSMEITDRVTSQVTEQTWQRIQRANTSLDNNQAER